MPGHIRRTSTWEDYERYPQSPKHHDALVDDAVRRDSRMVSDSERLFTARDNISIDVLDIVKDDVPSGDKRPATFSTPEQLEACLADEPEDLETRCYIIKPSNPKVISRCQLHISEEMMRKLLATHTIMPAFTSHIHAFGVKLSREQDASFGGGSYKLGVSPSTRSLSEHEICYTVKFAIQNKRRDPNSIYSWSIRQTSVYQKFDYTQKKTTWVLVQPDDAVRSRLSEVFGNDTGFEATAENALMMHLLFISSAAEGWREYFNSLEQHFLETTSAAVHVQVPRSGLKTVDFEGARNPLEQFEVDLQDVQDLQKYEEDLRALKTALEVNEDAIRALKGLNDKLRLLFGDERDAVVSWALLDAELEQQLAAVARHQRNVSTLLQKVSGRARLLYNVLEFKNDLAIAHQGQRAMEIKHLKRSESIMMRGITEMSARDAVGVKILTLLATLYLPASYVASFLDAGVVTFDADASGSSGVDFRRRTKFSKETTIFYIVFTVFLMTITFGCWWFWERRAKRSVDKKMVEEREKAMILSPRVGVDRMERMDGGLGIDRLV